MAETEKFSSRLLETNDEYRQLASKHSELDGRLQELYVKPHLSDTEHVEEVTLKKRKLQVKDRMEEIVRHHRDGTSGVSLSA